MGELLTIHPSWRGAPPFPIYRNPDSKDRKELMLRDEHRALRFFLAGDGSLYAGNAWEFLHSDEHTHLLNVFDASPFWSGELWLPGPHFPTGFGMTMRSDVRETARGYVRPDGSQHLDAEYNPRETILLARMSHYIARERGLLDQSVSWRRFTLGLSMQFEPIPPLPGFRVNEKIFPNSRAYVFLHGDGHLYVFDRDVDHFEAMHQLREAERALYPRALRCHSGGAGPVVGMQLGGNGNMHLRFSEVTQPLQFLLDNRNFRECFGEQIDFEVSESEIAIARQVASKWAKDRQVALGLKEDA